MFNTTITLQVIDNMARDVIIGFDTMIKWKAIINVDEQIVAIKANNQSHRIEFTNNSQPNCSAGPPHSINFTSVIQPQINDLLTKYNSIIPKDNDKPSTTAIVEFNIDTGDAPPAYSAPRIYHPEIQKKFDDKMEKLVDLGIVDKVLFSEWGSNITAVPKSNGDIRPCGNYVTLNAITKTIKYPFIHLHHALQSLGTSTIFSKIDLASGYYAIKIKAEDREKTALVTPNGTYVFNYMPFGLKNAPAVLQSIMDRVLGPLKNVTAIAYLDDIIIHSKSPSQHIRDVEQVLSRLKAANLSISEEKCAFGLKSVEFLGFIVSDKGISANPEKIAPILALSAPSNLKEVERFLGVCGVYQRFISNFQVVAEPLRLLKKKDTPFVWTEEQQNSFETLKKKLAELPTLIQPDFNKPFELHCDAATSSGIGVVLCQRDEEGHVYPLAFSSRSLSKFEQKYSVRELEALSIVWGIKKHRFYLEAGHFTVFTDHSSLQWLLSTNQDKQPRLWRWCLFLQAYDFQVKYVPGPTNFVADLLSRDPLPNIAVITLNPWSDDGWWTTEQVKVFALAKIIQSLQDGTLTVKSFYLKNKIPFKKVKYANKVRHFKVVPDHMVTTVISHYYASQFAGHGGSNKTLKAIQNSRLYFTNMDQRVTEITRSYLVCQRIKGNKNKQFPLSSTSGDYPFQKVALDYFGPLPTSNSNKSYILVIIDTFTRYVEIYAMASTNSMELAKTFYNGFILRHGVPEICFQDNAATFASEFNRQLASFAGIELQFSPPHVASSNGLVERYMKTLRNMLLIYCNQETIKTTWDTQLRLLRFVYNNMYHVQIKTSPFELVHGRKACTPLYLTEEEQRLTYPSEYRNTDTPQLYFAKELSKQLKTTFDIVFEQMNKYEEAC